MGRHWHAAALPFFCRFLRQRQDTAEHGASAFVVTERDCSEGMPAAEDGAVVVLVTGGIERGEDDQPQLTSPSSLTEQHALLQHVHRLVLASGLGRPGSTGVSMGRLCQDGALRSLLAGRPLVDALRGCADLDAHFELLEDAAHRGWYCRVAGGSTNGREQDGAAVGTASPVSTVASGAPVSGAAAAAAAAAGAAAAAAAAAASTEPCAVESAADDYQTAVEGDDVGLFSMTGHREAAIMTRVLAAAFVAHHHGCRAGSADGNSCGNVPAAAAAPAVAAAVAAAATAIDMTAGVGGNAMALAEVFGAVRAFELDDRRCEYLRRNVARARAMGKLRGNVSIVCGNSVAELLAVPPQQARSTTPTTTLPVIFIDPPWGGIHYKTAQQQQQQQQQQDGTGDFLSLDGVPLVDIVYRLVGIASVVGVKVPLSFDTCAFGAALLQREMAGRERADIRVAKVKKVFRQRLVVLNMPIVS